MAFNNVRFPAPMFNQNYPQVNSNINFGAGRIPRPPQFQRLNVPSGPFQPPERFTPPGFQSRPHFSNFPGPTGANSFMNRPPRPSSPHIVPPPSAPPHIHPAPPQQNFRFNSPPPSPRPRFNGPFDQPFRPWNHPPPFGGPRQPFQNRFRAPVSSHHSKDRPFQQIKKKQKIRDVRKLKSWMTDELFAEVKKKNALYLKAKSSDEQTAWQEFRLQRNRVSSLIKEAKIKAGLISRKVKEDDNTEKPFSCDTCDRAFVSENELGDHLSLHVKCDHQNCTFEAHPKIVALHQKMQHDTGYADAISKLKDDEEIKKWREERKRRFPTAENIKKRKAEQAEKEARGEVLETKEFGKFKRRKEENGHVANNNSDRGRGRRTRRFRSRKRFDDQRPSQTYAIKVDSDSDSDSDSHISLKKFSGMSSLTNSASDGCIQNENIENISNSHSPGDQDEEHCSSSHTSLEQNLPKNNTDDADSHSHEPYANNSTIGTADTSFHINDENHNESKSNDKSSESLTTNKVASDNVEPTDESVLEIPEDEASKPTKELVVIEDVDSDDEGPEVVSIMKNSEEIAIDKMNEGKSFSITKATAIPNNEKDNINGNKNMKYSKKQVSNTNKQFKNQDTVQTRKSSLLEKLLADDIRHERNVILQCIRHIVNNNFFGIGAKK